MPGLNNVQLETLKLFKHEKSEGELLEIKKILSEYLFDKAIRLADTDFEEKNYTAADVEQWKDEHTRLNRAF